MARRGSYAKGVAKREEILQRALEVIAREGYRGASVRELADAVGLSQAGLLHYFESKEELFTEILRKRDEVDRVAFEPEAVAAMEASDGTETDLVRAGFVSVLRHNSEVPGLVQLFSRLAVDAADPSHPAHAYFRDRDAQLQESLSDALGAMQEEGTITDRIDATTLALVIQSVADGLQVRWMHDPSVDMAGTVTALLDALAPTGTSTADE